MSYTLIEKNVQIVVGLNLSGNGLDFLSLNTPEVENTYLNAYNLKLKTYNSLHPNFLIPTFVL